MQTTNYKFSTTACTGEHGRSQGACTPNIWHI